MFKLSKCANEFIRLFLLALGSAFLFETHQQNIMYKQVKENTPLQHILFLKHSISLFLSSLSVVYFDQHLGAAHPNHWSKSSFSAFFVLKSAKR